MLVLGIDPGIVVLGYGLVQDIGDGLCLVQCGAVKCPRRLPTPSRLRLIYDRLVSIIEQYHPAVVATETPFVAHNVHSALDIGKAQAVAMLAAAVFQLPVYEYSPATIKQAITNYGDSSKAQVQEMVRLLLGLSEPPQPDDVADALAVAICHLYYERRESLLRG